MKKIILVAFAVAVAFTASAQDKTAPRTEYSVSLSENTLQLKPGETKQITVSILRSKSFAKASATLGLSSGLPEGIAVTYAPAEGMFENSVINITAVAGAKKGEYQIILKTTLNNKIKGSIIKLVVDAEPPKDAITAN